MGPSALDPADAAGPGEVARRAPAVLAARRPTAISLLAAGSVLLLLLSWLLLDPRTPDLAAQVYRAELFGRAGVVVWDPRWYGGHDIAGYSLLFPPLASALGVRVVGALAALASTLLFERIATRLCGRPAGAWAGALFAVGAVGDVWAGRITFALGVAPALGAVLMLLRGRRLPAAALAAAASAASPVAGVLLCLAALTWALAARSSRALAILAAPAAAVAAALAALFPEGGFEPFPLRSFAACAAVALAFLLALPRRARTLALGGGLYLLACVGSLAVHTPMGSNVERYGALLAGPALLAVLLRERAAVRPLAAGALAVILTWVVWGPVRESAAVAGSAATSAGYYAPVVRFLSTVPDRPVRVEVPLTRSHWEAALLAEHTLLARGWEKQLEERYDGVLLGGHLTPAAYLAWLRREAVGYVALPDARLDPSSAQEGRLIRSGPPYLIEVLRSAHWRIYRVLGATPLTSGPGSLTAAGFDSFTVRARAPGAITVRLRWSRYLALTGGRGCLGRSPAGWTIVRAAAPGVLTVAARFTISAALGLGGSCTAHGA